jgi:hypothetical protein
MGTVTVMTEPVLLQRDSRGRIPLGSLGTADRYLARADSQGRIVLEPAVVLTSTDERLLSDPEFIARMSEAANVPAETFEFDEL